MQTSLALSAPGNRVSDCVQGLTRLRISERLIDNDWNKSTPFLNPFYTIKFSRPHSCDPEDPEDPNILDEGHAPANLFDEEAGLPLAEPMFDRTEEIWAVAAWRAWWTQDTTFSERVRLDLTAPRSFRCDLASLHVLADGLMSSDGPRWPTQPHRQVVDSLSPGSPVIDTARKWAQCLTTYHCEGGQQDTSGDALVRVARFSNASGIALVVREKTHYPPNRMSSLWYNTATFEEVYEQKSREVRNMAGTGPLVMPRWASWLRIAMDIGTHLKRPLFSSDLRLINFAGELASASIIMARYPRKYSELVLLIYDDGLKARWTFGWSGLLACFTHLWTPERIHIAMLNGLSLLALSKTEHVRDINENVRSLLYGYAAFAVSDRAVGKRIEQDRMSELLTRYKADRGRTCRGSGVSATRLACKWLGIPAESSHMDGLPAFSTGWCSEYLERNPGNQSPEHGGSHDEVEMRHGSSNAWRYPYSHT